MRTRPDLHLAVELDEQLGNCDPTAAFEPYMWTWSKSVRDALGLTLVDVARLMHISQPAVGKLEHNESTGAITLDRLDALAHALHCRLVYGFMPRYPFTETAGHIERMQDAARIAKRRMPSAADILLSSAEW